MAGVDPDFGTSNFQEQKLFNETETVVNNILTLLFMKPGQFPSLPHIGIDIEQYMYEFFDAINVNEIKAKLTTQCKEFVPYVQGGSFDVIKTEHEGKPYLLIVLPVMIQDEVTGMIIGLTLDKSTGLVYNVQLDKNAIV